MNNWREDGGEFNRLRDRDNDGPLTGDPVGVEGKVSVIGQSETGPG